MKYLLLILILAGCYSERKAKEQFSKAAIAYPKLPADYCAITYPVKDSVITDTLTTTDTLYVDPLPADTVMIQDFDTIRIYITKTQPAKIITNTIRIRDTIYQTNTAALKSCELDNSRLIAVTTKQAGDIDKWQGTAKKRFWWILILAGAIVTYTGIKIYSAFKPKVNVTGKI